MEHLELTERFVVNKDWAFLFFLIGFGIIAWNKTLYDIRFHEFLKLSYSTKYIKIYKDSGLSNSFTFSLFLIQLISGTFFVQICLKTFGFLTDYTLLSYLRILNIITFFILAKFLIEKIIATTFKIEYFTEQFNLQKVSYRNYAATLIFPLNLILFYNNFDSNLLLFFIMFLLLTTNILLYILFLKNYQKLIVNKLFYFILYLCTLEIAPYFFLYYWFTK